MGDWPQGREANQVIISTGSKDAIGQELGCYFTSSVLTTAWPTANLALYIPFIIHDPWLLQLILISNGATVSGNVDVGVFDGQQNRIVSKGSAAQAGTSAVQSLDVTDTTLEPGRYYMGVALDNNVGMISGYAVAAPLPAAAGVLQQASAFPLPDPAVFAACAQSFVPNLALLGRSLA